MKKLLILMVVLAMATTSFADGRSVAGSTVTLVSPASGVYGDGDSFDIVLDVYNGSTDTEWLNEIVFTFAACFTVNSASIVNIDSGGDFMIDFDGVTGTNVARFLDLDGGWGEIYGESTAQCTINVTVDGCPDPYVPVIDWHLVGDIFGDEPHEMFGSLIMDGVVGNDTVTWSNVKAMFR